MPAPVVERAREVLAALEAERADGRKPRRQEQAPQMALLAEPAALEQELAALDLDGLTPLQALTRLYELKAKLKE
jgi:DNA mismatch repair protein MutS